MLKVTDNRKRNSWIMLLLWLVAVVCMVIYGQITHKKDLRIFHEKELRGTINYIDSSSGGDKVLLNNEEEKHLVFSEYNEQLETHMYRFIEIGDSLYKAKNDDYIHIFKGGEEYLFEIRK
jgi:hypothetical protein